MSNQSPSTAASASELLEPGAFCSLDEICVACNVDADWIVELVQHGAIEPVGQAQTDWQFTSVTITRVAKAKRLQSDLELNPPAVALVLDLLDQIHQLRRRAGD